MLNQYWLGVVLPESTEPEPLQSVPVLSLAEQGLDPDPPLGHRFLIGRCLVIRLDAVSGGQEREPLPEPWTISADGGKSPVSLR
jgi:hypothetical protein